jgi:hypothetical protein
VRYEGKGRRIEGSRASEVQQVELRAGGRLAARARAQAERAVEFLGGRPVERSASAVSARRARSGVRSEARSRTSACLSSMGIMRIVKSGDRGASQKP